LLAAPNSVAAAAPASPSSAGLAEASTGAPLLLLMVLYPSSAAWISFFLLCR
jgi:hypothetical protein